jgi:hypothetical protein
MVAMAYLLGASLLAGLTLPSWAGCHRGDYGYNNRGYYQGNARFNRYDNRYYQRGYTNNWRNDRYDDRPVYRGRAYQGRSLTESVVRGGLIGGGVGLGAGYFTDRDLLPSALVGAAVGAGVEVVRNYR